jgi:hemoglobin-like flavoprotein
LGKPFTGFGEAATGYLLPRRMRIIMSPDQLSELRIFFVRIEPRLPQAIATMYGRFLDAVPEARLLFKGNLEEQRRHFLRMLQEIVRHTRSTHLWPVHAFTGTQSIPSIDNLGRIHSCKGVIPEYFDKMKAMLVQCFREHCPNEFNQAAEEGLGFIFDVLAKASTNTCEISAEEIAHKNKLPRLEETQKQVSFASFFGAQVQEEAS